MPLSVSEVREDQKKKLLLVIQEERKLQEIASSSFLKWDVPPTEGLSISDYEGADYLFKCFKYIGWLVLLPSPEIICKLNLMRIRHQTTKWFVHINQIEAILLELSEIPEIFFPVGDYFDFIKFHLERKAQFSFLEGCGMGFDTIYNGKETNILFKIIAEGKRKEAYRKKKGYNSKSSPFENFLLKLYSEQLEESNGELDLAKEVQGNTKTFLDGLKFQFSKHISNRQIYIKVFDLLKLVFKDLDLLDEDTFIKDHNGYYRNYDEYKYHYVKNFSR